MPQCLLHRDARNVAFPEHFIPERWTTNPEMVINKSAFMPFSMGMTNCPGKPLAMMELRSVVARTFCEFDVYFEDGVDFEKKFFNSEKDHSGSRCPRIDLVFKNRGGDGVVGA